MTGRGRGVTSRPEGGGGLRGWVEVGMARVRCRGATSRPEGGGEVRGWVEVGMPGVKGRGRGVPSIPELEGNSS